MAIHHLSFFFRPGRMLPHTDTCTRRGYKYSTYSKPDSPLQAYARKGSSRLTGTRPAWDYSPKTSALGGQETLAKKAQLERPRTVGPTQSHDEYQPSEYETRNHSIRPLEIEVLGTGSKLAPQSSYEWGRQRAYGHKVQYKGDDGVAKVFDKRDDPYTQYDGDYY